MKRGLHSVVPYREVSSARGGGGLYSYYALNKWCYRFYKLWFAYIDRITQFGVWMSSNAVVEMTAR